MSDLTYFTTKPAPIQGPLAVLLDQAVSRMECDPGNYDRHFMIWLSLNALATGAGWPGDVRDE